MLTAAETDGAVQLEEGGELASGTGGFAATSCDVVSQRLGPVASWKPCHTHIQQESAAMMLLDVHGAPRRAWILEGREEDPGELSKGQAEIGLIAASG